MKWYVLIFLLGSLWCCKKEDADPTVPPGALVKITAGDKLLSTLEYRNGRVSQLLEYSGCEIPYSVTEFRYSGERLTSVRVSKKDLLSSWSPQLCDPESPYYTLNYAIEYDEQGRRTKVSWESGTVTYAYNGRKVTVEQTDKSGSWWNRYYLLLDDKDNVIERSTLPGDPSRTIRYEYDNSPNPLAGLTTYESLNPFATANNNIKAFDPEGQQLWYRQFTYDQKGRPATYEEGNGIVYQYTYQ